MTMELDEFEAMCARRGLDPDRLRRGRKRCLEKHERAKAAYQARKLLLSGEMPLRVAQAAKTHDGKGWVYFAKCQSFIKIGFALHSVHERLDCLRNANPFPLTLIGALPGAITLEKELHRIFLPYHHRGEWFHAHPDVESVYPLLRKIKRKSIQKPRRTSILGFLIAESTR